MLAYIHIPFCDSKCHYCAFNSYVDKLGSRERYMAALATQCAYEIERFGAQRGSIETLFIGGGTPSTVTPRLFAPVFALLSPYLSADAEITVEANPNSASANWLKGMRDLGVNRVSFGVQSFDPEKLRFLGRAHSPAQAIDAITTASKIGYEHLSLDLIYNASGDNRELLRRDIKQALDLPTDHISAYELTIESNTPFAATPNARQEDNKLAFFVAEEIGRYGFDHYEISNFGSYQSRHNIGYWDQKEYLGIGAGAVGFLGRHRLYPPTSVEQYITNPLEINMEELSDNDILTEHIFLGLRSMIGIDKNRIPKKILERANFLVAEEKLFYKKGRFLSTDFFLADEVALYLLGD